MNDIEFYRDKIDLVDREIVNLLTERFEIARDIAELKKNIDIDVFDKKREEEIFAKLKDWAKELNLDEDFLRKIFELIIKESRKIQKDKLS